MALFFASFYGKQCENINLYMIERALKMIPIILYEYSVTTVNSLLYCLLLSTTYILIAFLLIEINFQ